VWAVIRNNSLKYPSHEVDLVMMAIHWRSVIQGIDEINRLRTSGSILKQLFQFKSKADQGVSPLRTKMLGTMVHVKIVPVWDRFTAHCLAYLCLNTFFKLI
jgi:hypothetical protein